MKKQLLLIALSFSLTSIAFLREDPDKERDKEREKEVSKNDNAHSNNKEQEQWKRKLSQRPL